jgi:hypothetical protein
MDKRFFALRAKAGYLSLRFRHKPDDLWLELSMMMVNNRYTSTYQDLYERIDLHRNIENPAAEAKTIRMIREKIAQVIKNENVTDIDKLFMADLYSLYFEGYDQDLDQHMKLMKIYQTIKPIWLKISNEQEIPLKHIYYNSIFRLIDEIQQKKRYFLEFGIDGMRRFYMETYLLITTVTQGEDNTYLGCVDDVYWMICGDKKEN